MTSQEADAGIRPRPAKRSLFNRPAWSNPPSHPQTQPAQTSTEEGENAVDLFSRSKQIFGDIVKEQEETRRQKAAKTLRDKTREEEARVDRLRKRRRVEEEEQEQEQDEGEEVDLDRNGSLDAVNIGLNDDSKYDRSSLDQDSQGLTDLLRIEDSSPRGATAFDQSPSSDGLATSFSSALIPAGLEQRGGLSVEVSDDEESTAKPSSQSIQGQTEGQQQQQRRRRQLQTGSASARQHDALLTEDEHDRQGSDIEPSKEPSTLLTVGESTVEEGDILSSRAPVSEPSEIKVDILITSRIPNTKPLIVQRKVHQSLRQVRFAWCSHQAFDVQTMYDIFLTWRGKRLFDVTTCRSLGIGTEDNCLHHDVKEDLFETTAVGVVENRQVHMEAMTEEIFEQVRRAREKQQQQGGDLFNLNDLTSSKNDDDDDDDQTETRVDHKEEQIRIILKSKGREDFKLIVKPVCIFRHPPVDNPLIREMKILSLVE